MSKKIEILPVTANEIMCLLGQLRMEDVDRILYDIKILRKVELFSIESFLVQIEQGFRENTENKILLVVS
jgi:hypothetical protein